VDLIAARWTVSETDLYEVVANVFGRTTGERIAADPGVPFSLFDATSEHSGFSRCAGCRRGPRVFGGNPSRELVWCRLLRTGRECTVGPGSSATASLASLSPLLSPKVRQTTATEGTAAVHDRSEDIDVAWLDRVINHIFASGLSLASVLSRLQVDDDIAEHLACVIDELDSAVRELRSDAFDHALRDRDDVRLRASQHDLGADAPLYCDLAPAGLLAVASAGMSLAASPCSADTLQRRLSNDPPRRRRLP
jgi:hypothetical protein